MAEDLFAVDTVDGLRLRFVSEAGGSYRLEALYEDGRTAEYRRTDL